MAAAAGRPITFEETELLSFLHQNIIHKLCEEAQRQGPPKTDPWVVRAMVAYFNGGPAPHGVFHNQIAWHTRSKGEFRGSQFSHPTSDLFWWLTISVAQKIGAT